MSIILKQSTGIDVRIGPFVDVGDGFTPETGITLGSADEAELLKANGAATVDISGRTWAAVTSCDGWYDLTLTTADTNTIGELVVVVQDDSVCLPVYQRFQVVEEAVYDDLFAASADPFTVMQSDAAHVESTLVVWEGAGGVVSDMASGVNVIQTAVANGTLSDITSKLVVVEDFASDLDSRLTATVVSDLSSGVDAIQAAGGSLSAAQDSKLTEIHGDVNNTESQLDVTDGVVDQVYSRLQVVENGADSGQLIVESYLSDIYSLCTDIDSSAEAIEAGGGSLTSDQNSKLTAIEDYASDLESRLTAVIVSDLSSGVDAIQAAGGSLTSDQNSKLTAIAGTVLVGGALEDMVSDADSKATQIYSRLQIVETAIDSDTASAATAVANVDSQVTATYSRLQVVETAIDSDTASAATAVANVDSQVTATYSRLQVVETAIDSDTASAATKLDDIVSGVNDAQSGVDAVQTQASTIASDAALLEAAHAEPTGVPAANESPLDKLAYLFMAMRNKKTVTATKHTVFDDGGTAEWEYDLTDDDTTMTESKANAP